MFIKLNCSCNNYASTSYYPPILVFTVLSYFCSLFVLSFVVHSGGTNVRLLHSAGKIFCLMTATKAIKTETDTTQSIVMLLLRSIFMHHDSI